MLPQIPSQRTHAYFPMIYPPETKPVKHTSKPEGNTTGNSQSLSVSMSPQCAKTWKNFIGHMPDMARLHRLFKNLVKIYRLQEKQRLVQEGVYNVNHTKEEDDANLTGRMDCLFSLAVRHLELLEKPDIFPRELEFFNAACEERSYKNLFILINNSLEKDLTYSSLIQAISTMGINLEEALTAGEVANANLDKFYDERLEYAIRSARMLPFSSEPDDGRSVTRLRAAYPKTLMGGPDYTIGGLNDGFCFRQSENSVKERSVLDDRHASDRTQALSDPTYEGRDTQSARDVHSNLRMTREGTYQNATTQQFTGILIILGLVFLACLLIRPKKTR